MGLERDINIKETEREIEIERLILGYGGLPRESEGKIDVEREKEIEIRNLYREILGLVI